MDEQYKGLECRVRKLEEDYARQDERGKSIETQLGNISAKVEILVGSAGKRWERVIEILIAAGVGYAFSLIK